jgi:SOS response regulatory protein OraA/RecX
MTRAGYDGEEIERTLGFLRERRYLDDRTYARDFARNRNQHRLWGPARIEARLRALHLSEEESARRALDRFLRHPRTGLSREKRMAKAYRHLLTRGFSPSVAHRLVSSPDFEDTGS